VKSTSSRGRPARCQHRWTPTHSGRPSIRSWGVDLKINIQPQADYPTVKLPTLIAGGELPDILYIATNSVIPQFPTFLKSKCADLTPYLSGDAVKEYPNLANFPTLAWKQVIYNNAIYGVPVPYPLYLWVHWVHQNLLDDEGLSRPKNAEEYKNLGQHFTRARPEPVGDGGRKQRRFGRDQRLAERYFRHANIWALDEKTGQAYGTRGDRAVPRRGQLCKDCEHRHLPSNAMQYNLVSARNDFAARRFAFRFGRLPERVYHVLG